MASVWSATGMVISALQHVLRSRLTVSGVAGLKYAGPTLFVANHFTRFETALIPYLLYNETGRVARSLADGALFKGGLNGFLRRVNVFPNNDPHFKEQIVDDLITGHHDWVIFPEGAMVKTKRIRNKAGDLWIEHPWRAGLPHTGAAVFALQAEIRRSALAGVFGEHTQTWAKGEVGNLTPHAQPVQVVPVTFTYFPLRPGDNAIHQAVRWLVGELPPTVQEELNVEGNLLLGDCNIDVHFGQPIVLEPRVQATWRRMRCGDEGCSPEKIDKAVVDHRRLKLTKQAMRTVYKSVQINPDHLLTVALQRCGRHEVSREHLILTSFLAVRAINRHSGLRLHPTTLPTLEQALTVGSAPVIDKFFAFGSETGVLDVEGDLIRLNRRNLATRHGFNAQRLHNPLAVIANELRGAPGAVAVVRRYASMSIKDLRKELATALISDAAYRFETAYEKYHNPELSRETDIGMPRLLGSPGAKHAVVLSHGYLSAPQEVRELGESLQNAGLAVYLVRLPGHGTAPRNLADITWKDWLTAYQRGLTALGMLHDSVVCGGFSTGGLLALCASTHSTARIAGVVSINAPTRLVDRRARMVPLVRKWSRAMVHFGKTYEPQWIPNPTESPDINYTRNYLHGVAELIDLMDHTQSQLHSVTAPALIIQGDHDPVVEPQSGHELIDGISSTRKHLVSLNRKRHVIVRGDGADEVARIVTGFCQDCCGHLRPPQSASA